MTSGSWLLEEIGAEVNCVVPKKMVTPVLSLDAGSSAPAAVEVRRTFETFPRRLLAKAMRATTTRPRERQLVKREGQVALYKPWPAARYQPWRRPTLFEFRDPSGSWGGLSEPLQVFQDGVNVTVPQSRFEPYVGANYGPVEGRVGLRVNQGEVIEMLLDVAVDPEVEPFAFSPVEDLGDIAFESYVETSLAEIEEALAADDLSSDGFRAAFEEDYGDFVGDTSGQIFASFDSDRVSVEPGRTSRVKVTLHGEREGGMLMVLGARHLGTGEVTFSELLPLIWRPMEDAARASHEEAARKQAILRREAATRPRLRPRGDAPGLVGDRAPNRSAAIAR
jgi:hypothetical protein